MPNLTSFRRNQLRVLHPAKILFTMVPKAGNTSLRQAFHFAMGAGTNFKTTDDSFRIGKAISREASIPQDYLKMMVVRNPWSRFMSGYTNKVDGRSREGGGKRIRGELARIGCYRNMSFETFTEIACATDDYAIDKHFAPVHYLIENPLWGGAPDIMLRLEDQPDMWFELVRIFKERGFTMPLAMPQANNSLHIPKPRWTPKLINMVGDRYARDIEILNYEAPTCSR